MDNLLASTFVVHHIKYQKRLDLLTHTHKKIKIAIILVTFYDSDQVKLFSVYLDDFIFGGLLG